LHHSEAECIFASIGYWLDSIIVQRFGAVDLFAVCTRVNHSEASSLLSLYSVRVRNGSETQITRMLIRFSFQTRFLALQ
jgi:hypothetical protein